jgi:hypothetical protein
MRSSVMLLASLMQFDDQSVLFEVIANPLALGE